MALVNSLASDITVVLLTARPWHLLDDTVAWLKAHQVRWDLLILRPPNSGERSRAYKAAEVANLRQHGFDLLCALGGRPPQRGDVQRGRRPLRLRLLRLLRPLRGDWCRQPVADPQNLIFKLEWR